jgi:hypothetical protein
MSRPKRILTLLKRALLFFPCAFLLLEIFPQPLFAHATRYSNLVLYSRKPLPLKATAILAKADRLLASSELYSTNQIRRIFLCDSYPLYRALSLGQKYSFGCSFPNTTKHVFIPKADLLNDLALAQKAHPADTRKRDLSAIIAHELLHITVGEFLGRMAYWRLRRTAPWVDEGYCDFISRSSSVSLDEGVRSILERPFRASAVPYVQARIMVGWVINEKGLNATNLLLHPPNGRVISEELKAVLRTDSPLDPKRIEPRQKHFFTW